MSSSIRIAGLFAGIGGIELGFHRALGEGAETVLLCESWTPARAVLAARFPEVELHPDVRLFKDLPTGLDVLTAGFPCTDLSQAGRTAGIGGAASGLVAHVFEALRMAEKRTRLPWLMVENVPNMLALDRGRAMAYLISEIEALGYRWAYRIVDTRATGLPQRRRRVILLASRTEDPRAVLFSDDAGDRDPESYSDDAFGFYWTEGRGGLGWARDAVPTLKGGSTIGISSPPAIWIPRAEMGREFVKPSIEDAEQLQGFARGWTEPSNEAGRRNGPRWKLVGNAVTVEVSSWLAGRLVHPGEVMGESCSWNGAGAWPTAAWGDSGKIWASSVSEFPIQKPYVHLLDVVDTDTAEPLSLRGTKGFWNRLQQGNLGRHAGFRESVAAHAQAMDLQTALFDNDMRSSRAEAG
ncbi:MAG: DNA (cytosine-5-)-methyltransferase [Actinomycetota bacterium]|nr:DNA (cytosine-5-)-methyltransferase [Actinomycetota bacterium]